MSSLISSILEGVVGIRRFQAVDNPENHLELRLEVVEGHNKENIYAEASRVLREFLSTHGIQTVTLSLSEEEPQQHSQSGKFKHVLILNKESGRI